MMEQHHHRHRGPWQLGPGEGPITTGRTGINQQTGEVTFYNPPEVWSTFIRPWRNERPHRPHPPRWPPPQWHCPPCNPCSCGNIFARLLTDPRIWGM